MKGKKIINTLLFLVFATSCGMTMAETETENKKMTYNVTVVNHSGKNLCVKAKSDYFGKEAAFGGPVIDKDKEHVFSTSYATTKGFVSFEVGVDQGEGTPIVCSGPIAHCVFDTESSNGKRIILDKDLKCTVN